MLAHLVTTDRLMRKGLLILIPAAILLLGPSSLAAPNGQPPSSEEERPATRCETESLAILKRAASYAESALNSSAPFDQTDKNTKACGVLLQGMDTLREMGCPQDLIDLLAEAQREAESLIDQLNDRYDFHFRCDTPEYRRASVFPPGLGLRG